MLTINNTLDGYLKDVEIKGNTIQNASNLADIRSVGDKIEGQELYEIPVLSVGKNLIDCAKFYGHTTSISTIQILKDANSIKINGNGSYASARIKLNLKKGEYIVSKDCVVTLGGTTTGRCFIYINNTHTYTLVNTKQSQKISLTSDSEVMIDLIGTWGEQTTFDATFNIQLEEGTVATPYEPYIENKLTILSPIPLEKVGDVADRLICKDGVCGVEKNVATVVLNGSESWTNSSIITTNTIRFLFNLGDNKYKVAPICDTFKGQLYTDADVEGAFIGGSTSLGISILKTKLATQDVAGFKAWLQANPITVKYVLTTPQFIPLPYDQQIKLRTFAGKTNISFGCEIEGTIKAQVPKSIGATVNTHTEQINNLNKELDRVKKLEESTVSTVTTESDFTTVEQTSNGYFEDVKLEGKTLVNLSLVKNYNSSLGSRISVLSEKREFNSVFTVFVNIVEDNTVNGVGFEFTDTSGNYTYKNLTPKTIGRQVFKVNHSLPINKIRIYIENNDYNNNLHSSVKDIIILEGDHTQNPPSYFEGLKSVGQSATTSEDGVDEISIESVDNGNMIDLSNITEGKYITSTSGNIRDNANSFYCNTLIPISPNMNIVFRTTTGAKQMGIFLYYDEDKQFISGQELANNTYLTIPQNTKYLRLSFYNRLDIKECLYVGLGDKPVLIDYQSDKKRLLYYNEETQIWEKPILRQWDSIEKHADGKYYYHQRSAEVVLNGSEEWSSDSNSSTISPPTYRQSIMFNSISIPNSTFDTNISHNLISDLLPSVRFSNIFNHNHIGISIYGKGNIGTHIVVNNGFENATELKQWLQTNPVTLVYQLAQEKVYECTNIGLITYNGETNFIVESGVLSPKTTLKVHNNISNVVSLLQKKVSLLESNMTKYMITQNRLQLSSTHSADSVTFKVDYTVCSENMSQENYDTDLYNLILNNILVGKDNYNYDRMFNIIMDYASWSQISWDQFDILVGLMDIQHNPPIEEIPTDDEIVEEIPNEIM